MRRCLGESLARMENLLFLANLLNNFSFEAAKAGLPDLLPECGVTNGPQPFLVRAVPAG